MDVLGIGRRVEERAPLMVLTLAAAAGVASLAFYYLQDLTTAHYDAKAHLVVARRVVDSVHPGYSQLGIHWLPLIHLIYLPLVVSDAQYQTGLLPAFVSVVALVVSAWMVFRIVRRLTASALDGLFAGVLLLGNANLRYLSSCPLTEPVFMALMLLAVDALIAWRESPAAGAPVAASLWTALAALCRYEGWYFLAALVVLLAWDWYSGHLERRRVLRGALLILSVFALLAAAHFGYIYGRLGDSFLHRVAQGNPAPYETFRRPVLSTLYHLGELTQIAGILPLVLGIAGTVYCLARRRPLAGWVPLLLLWTPSLVNISALYWGLIYRVRYSVLLLPAICCFGAMILRSQHGARRLFLALSVAAMGLPWLTWYFPHDWEHRFVRPGPGILALPLAGLALFLVVRAGGAVRIAMLVLALLWMHVPVLEGEHLPIMGETLEHAFVEHQRKEVLAHLRSQYDGTRILVDMERQAPLIYDSRLAIREFIYNEGNRRVWDDALASPHRSVGWICAGLDDEVWRRLQVDPQWTGRYSLAVQNHAFRLYRIHPGEREALLPPRFSER